MTALTVSIIANRQRDTTAAHFLEDFNTQPVE